MTPQKIQEQIKRIKRNNLLKWLADRDYIINKIVLGEWEKTDPRYTAYLEERAKVRAALDQLDQQ